MNDKQPDDIRIINLRLSESEINAVRQITKVDAIAPGVVAIVRKAIELYKEGRF